MNEKQEYLNELLERKFHSELCTKSEADIIICLAKDNGINTDQLEHDYKFKFDESFELIK
jgi:hypothetical protein